MHNTNKRSSLGFQFDLLLPYYFNYWKRNTLEDYGHYLRYIQQSQERN